MIGVTALIVRISGRYPMAVGVGRVSVIATNPGILPVLPFIVSGNPDSRMIGTCPAVILLRWWRGLVANLKNKSLSVGGDNH